MRFVICVGAALLAAACSEQPAQQPAAAEAANASAPQPKKAPHCFFKDKETEKWAVRVQGANALVTGRAYRSDPRYKAVLLEPEVEGSVAVVRPSITINDTGFASEGNWWDVSATVPAAGLERIEVRCGKTVVTSLELPKKAG